MNKLLQIYLSLTGIHVRQMEIREAMKSYLDCLRMEIIVPNAWFLMRKMTKVIHKNYAHGLIPNALNWIKRRVYLDHL